MPLYDWRCNACNHVTETLAKYSERDQPVPCEACGSDDVDRCPPETKRQNFRFNRDPRTKKANLSEV